MKNEEAAISSRRKGEGREVKSLRNGGVKNFRTGGGRVTNMGTMLLLLGRGFRPLYMPWLFQVSHNCVTECTLQAIFLLKLI